LEALEGLDILGFPRDRENLPPALSSASPKKFKRE